MDEPYPSISNQHVSQFCSKYYNILVCAMCSCQNPFRTDEGTSTKPEKKRINLTETISSIAHKSQTEQYPIKLTDLFCNAIAFATPINILLFSKQSSLQHKSKLNRIDTWEVWIFSWLNPEDYWKVVTYLIATYPDTVALAISMSSLTYNLNNNMMTKPKS